MFGKFRRAVILLAAATLGLAGAVVVAAPAHAASIPVTSLLDDNSGGTLREAIVAAEANADPSNTITIAITGVIDLTGPLPLVTKSLTIDGPGDALIVRKGAWAGDIISIQPDAANQDFVFKDFAFDGDGANHGRALLTDNNGGFGIRDLTLESLTVTDFVSFGSGGAGSLLDVTGTILIDGGSFADGWAGNNGGALYVGQSNDVTIHGTSFRDFFNGTGNGAALAFENVADILVDEGAEFEGNDAWANGGGLWAGDFTTATFNDVEFDENTSHDGVGGGAYFHDGGSVSLTDGTFTTNTAGTSGGGFYADAIDTLVTVQNTSFTENTAHNGDGGGFFAGGSPTMAVQIGTGSSFTDNEAESPDGVGRGGAVAVVTYGTFTSNDVTYTDNDADNGGAIYSGATYQSFLAELSTFTGNVAHDGYGGAIHVIAMNTAQQSVTLRNSTFDGNTAVGIVAYGGAFAIGDTADDTVLSVESSTFTDNVLDGFVGDGVSIAAYATDTVNGRIDIVNSTFVENQDTDAYAVFVAHVGDATGLLTVRNTTMLGIGGVLVDVNDGGVQIINSIIEAIALQSVALGSESTPFTAQYSIFTSAYDPAVIADDATNQFEVADTRLGILGNNGGPTETRLPEDDSPAVNTGNAAIETSLPPNDQRGPGFLRVQGVALDIGAVEIQIPPLPATGSTIPMWIPIVGGVVLLVGIAAIVFTVVSRRRVHAAEAAAAAPKPPSEPTAG